MGHPDQVQVWDISLVELRSVAATAVTALRWATSGATEAQAQRVDQLWEKVGSLLEELPATAPLPFGELYDFLAGPHGHSTGLEAQSMMGSPEPYWHVEFLVRSAGRRGSPPDWYVRAGRQFGHRFMEFVVCRQLRGRSLEVRIQPSSRRGHPDSYPRSLALFRRSADVRRRLHESDATEQSPIVLVDYDWDDESKASSAIAQLIDWYFRVAATTVAGALNCPKPDDDAIAWWFEWVKETCPSGDEIGFEDALRVARRSVRPATPAGHRTYWRESLRLRSRAFVDQACGHVGISRTTAYNRLRRAGLKREQFDSVHDLANFLIEAAPSRRVPDERKQIIEVLIEAGAKPETARKFEQRLRVLPQDEQHRRLLRRLESLRTRLGQSGHS